MSNTGTGGSLATTLRYYRRLSATVSNTGTGGSLATTLRYYRSTGDTQVGTGAVGALASGDEASSIDLTTPSTPGAYYYGACVDAASGE